MNYTEPFYVEDNQKIYYDWYKLALFCRYGNSYRVEFLKNTIEFTGEELEQWVNDGLFSISCVNGGTSVSLTDRGFSAAKLAAEKVGINLKRITED